MEKIIYTIDKKCFSEYISYVRFDQDMANQIRLASLFGALLLIVVDLIA